ncbi:MAG: NAD-dependent epimerase/dehydratase family protein, partial [Flavobacteriaceae bacterium]|nr:NAD-dependent epimerase/dehydratase family protein [Flavobacteriaceae bacterium]
MILVTGGTGMVGAHLLVECVKKKQNLVATFRREESIDVVKKVFESIAPEYLKDFALIQWKKAPLNDINALDDAFQGVEYVYHCAAKVSSADHKPESLKKSNI